MSRFLKFTQFVVPILIILPGTGAAERTPAFDSLHQWYQENYPFFTMKDSLFTFESEFSLPEDYRWLEEKHMNDFQYWVSRFPLWHQKKVICEWRGKVVLAADDVSRGVHLPWRTNRFRDYAIPLRILGEYFFHIDRRDRLAFTPPKGNVVTYSAWLSGKPALTAQGEVFFKEGDKREDKPDEFYQYISYIMQTTSYANLAANCEAISPQEVYPGDLFIAHDEKDRQGTVCIILNMIENSRGDRQYIVATGCPEACDFHIPKLNADRQYPWVTIGQIEALGKDFSLAGFFRFKQL
jgi:hypothetical protein